MTPTAALALVTLLLAALQLVLARWRDLGSLTIGFGGATVAAWAGDTEWLASAPLVVGAAALAAAAWVRGAAVGVGRIGLGGIAMFAAVATGVCVRFVPSVWHAVPASRIVDAGAVISASVGAMLALIALERPSDRPALPFVRLRVPVEDQGGVATTPESQSATT